MEKSLQETREMLGLAQETLRSGIMRGVVPIEVPAEQIIDEVGTDRILDLPDDEGDAQSLRSLVDNIRTRGQRVPIRLRPQDPEWQPSQEAPRDVGGAIFVLQSGRRRLAACLELGIAPRAFISLDEGDARINDLKERFFENAARKNLSLIEKLYSIGLLARDMGDMTQAAISEAIGVNQPYISRGLAVVEYFERLQQDINLAEATARDIDSALKSYRTAPAQVDPLAGERETPALKEKIEGASLPFSKRKIGNSRITLKTNARGERILSLRSAALDNPTIEKILDLLKQTDNGGRGMICPASHTQVC